MKSTQPAKRRSDLASQPHPRYNRTAMTTLIIHPEFEVQKYHALKLTGEYLEHDPETLLTKSPPDLHLLDGTVSSSIGIQEVRDLLRRLQYQPYQSPAQVGLILMANTLTEEAQNSLLKSLEEPGPLTRFILTTPHERFLLPTIISRSNVRFINERIVIHTQEKPLNHLPAKEFLERDLANRLLYTETLIEADTQTAGTITSFLTHLLKHFRGELLTRIMRGKTAESRMYAQIIKKIHKALHFLKYNANKRLTLENLILQLEESIITLRD